MRRRQPAQPEQVRTGPPRRDVLWYCIDPAEWVDRNGEPSPELLAAVAERRARQAQSIRANR